MTLALRETYADALVAAGRYAEAEPLVWQLFEQNPARVQQVIGLIGNLLDGGPKKPRWRWRASWNNSSGGAASGGSSSRSWKTSRRRTSFVADAGVPERTL